jgi:Leucine-rich repeat (LRR) protein/translation initiation factor IF-1
VVEVKKLNIRNIIIFILVFIGLSGIILGVDLTFNKPTTFNKIIAAKLYKEPANKAFTDQNFYNCVIDAYNNENQTNKVPYTYNLSDDELKSITQLICHNKVIDNTMGLEKMSSLTRLYLSSNELSELDVSNNISLVTLSVTSNSLSKLDVSKNVALTQLIVYYNQLTDLITTGATSLKKIDAGHNLLTEINIENNKLLETLDIRQNYITDINLAENSNLMELTACYNGLKTLNITNNKKLTTLIVGECTRGSESGNYENNKLTTLNVSNNSKLRTLNASSNQLEELITTGANELTSLIVDRNRLVTLDLTTNTALLKIEASYNRLTELDLSKNTLLKQLYLGTYVGGYYKSCENCYKNQLITLNISNNPDLEQVYLNDNQLKELELINNPKLTYLDANDNQLSTIITSGATSLERLEIDNNKIRDLNLSKNNNLSELWANKNQIETIIFPEKDQLKMIYLTSNKLKSISSSSELLTGLFLADNLLEKIDLSKNVNLRRIDLGYYCCSHHGYSSCYYGNEITNVDFSNNIHLEEVYMPNNKIRELDLTKNVELKTLYLQNNNLSSIDLSQNTALKTLDIRNNPYGKEYYVYKGEKILVNDIVKIPTHLNWSNPSWSSSNSSIAAVDQNGDITTLQIGNAIIKGDVNSRYSITNNINIVDITSDVYTINNDDNYIYVKTDNNIDVIKENINISHEEIDINIDLDNNKLQVKHSENILKEFKIIKLNSLLYDLTKEYIYTGPNPFDKTKVSVTNGTAVVEENKLKIKYQDIELQSFDIVTITSTTYDLTKEYIYTGPNPFDKTKVSIINGTSTVEDNKLKIKYKDIELQSMDIVTISSTEYKLTKECIYTGPNLFDKAKVSVTNGTVVVGDNELKVKYKDIELESFDIVTISSAEYKLVTEYIYTGPNPFDKAKISVTNGTAVVEENKLIIKYQDIELQSFDIVTISSTEYKLKKEYIYTGPNPFDKEKVSVTNGTAVVEENKLKIKYQDIELQSFDIVTISSTTYDLTKKYIYTETNPFDNEKVSIINGTAVVEDNKLKIKYKDIELKSFYLIHISFGELQVKNKNIIILDEMDYDDFVSNIDINKATYKIFDGYDEVTSGKIRKGMVLSIYYNDTEIDSFNVIDEFLDLSLLNVDEDKKYILDIKLGTKVSELISKVDTSGQVSIIHQDKELSNTANLRTGSKLKVELSSETHYYEIVVIGDVNGDGKMNVSDIVKINNHIIDATKRLDTIYLLAGDYNGDNKLNIQDIVKVNNAIVGGN